MDSQTSGATAHNIAEITKDVMAALKLPAARASRLLMSMDPEALKALGINFEALGAATEIIAELDGVKVLFVPDTGEQVLPSIDLSQRGNAAEMLLPLGPVPQGPLGPQGTHALAASLFMRLQDAIYLPHDQARPQIVQIVKEASQLVPALEGVGVDLRNVATVFEEALRVIAPDRLASTTGTAANKLLAQAIESRPATTDEPRAGDVVYYVLSAGNSKGQLRAAHVIRNQGGGVLNLQLLLDGKADQGASPYVPGAKRAANPSSPEAGSWLTRPA